MGRPRQHDERTREALLVAAERRLAEGGLDALSVRGVADDVGTTTRAVYSVFGSKEGMLEALAIRGFEYLTAGLDALPVTADPVQDLVEAGVTMYRRFLVEHPAVYRLTFQRIAPDLPLGEGFRAARSEAFGRLESRVRRLKDAGLLGRKSVRAAAVEFNAMCEGLANAEIRGGTLRLVPQGHEDRVWRDAFRTLLRGLTVAHR